MKPTAMKKIFNDTAYIRMGGTDQELRTAEYLKSCCEKLGLNAWLEEFPVEMATLHKAKLTIDGVEIPCKGYFNAGSGTVEAPFYYLSSADRHTLAGCKGRIVMTDGYLGKWRYQDLLDNGAVGFITYSGDPNHPNHDIDQRELRSLVHQGNKIPGVNINVRDAIAINAKHGKMAAITLEQEEFEGKSHNVIAELPGETDSWIVLSAHYDSTSLSQGAYDNMSGCVGILGIAEALKGKRLRRGLRLVFCGSEERGLLGSKAYCEKHEEDLKNVDLNINLDMVGCIMGKFIACCSAEEKLCNYIEYMGYELGFPVSTRADVYSSDSTPFADKGVPALSFARVAMGLFPIHNRYDTQKVMSMTQMQGDIDFMAAFTQRMANAVTIPVKREIPQSIKDKLDSYLGRKRPENA